MAMAEFARLQSCVRPATERELHERAERNREWNTLIEEGVCHTCRYIARGEATSNSDGALLFENEQCFRDSRTIPARSGPHDRDRQTTRPGYRRTVGRVRLRVDDDYAPADPGAEGGYGLRQSLPGHHVFRKGVPPALSVDTETARRTDRRRRLFEHAPVSGFRGTPG